MFFLGQSLKYKLQIRNPLRIEFSKGTVQGKFSISFTHFNEPLLETKQANTVD